MFKKKSDAIIQVKITESNGEGNVDIHVAGSGQLLHRGLVNLFKGLAVKSETKRILLIAINEFTEEMDNHNE